MRNYFILIILIISMFTLINANPYSFNLYDSPATTTIINGTGNVSDHNNLTGLQGGNSPDEFYHLNLSVFNEIMSEVFDWVTQSEGNNLWCKLTGCTIAGELNLTGNLSLQDPSTLDCQNANEVLTTNANGQLICVASSIDNVYTIYFNHSNKNIITYNLTNSDASIITVHTVSGQKEIYGGEFT